MVDNILGRNKVFPIYNEDGTPFHDLALKKSTVDSVVMSLGDKITGDVYYKDTTLSVTMGEYIVYNDVKYTLVNPPTVVKEGMVSDNGDLNGMTKYSFVFYHPMYHLLNFPFTDVAVQVGQEKYLSQNKSFSWIGTLVDYVAKINKNLQGTQWICAISSNVPQEERTALSEVMAFDNATIADALKRGYETWEVPYIIDQIKEVETYYSQGKRFLIQFGLPSQEIIGTNNQPFVFQYGQGVGLKNHSRNPRNNKIITRIAGYGSEDNIPWGYPQIVWTGNQDWNYTVNNNPSASNSYPIYDGIVGGAKVKLIKHPFTRTHLMPSIYRDTVNRKVNPYASGYNPSIEIKDYYDADSTYTNPIVQDTPSYEIHEFDKIKPELGVSQIVNAVPYDGIVGNDEVLLADFRLKILERASSTSIDMERDALLGLYDNIVLPSSYADSGSQEAYNYQSSIGSATDDKRQVEFKSSNINFSEVVVVSNQTPSSSTGWIDDIDEDGNYIQSYFKITLPVLSFDLYASAALTQEMSINMRSGACIGCTFQVQVDWEDYRNNFYDAAGNFAPNGAQRNLDKYPKSDEQQITVIVQKDINTFGTIMPSIYQQPAAGDKYVILGISLPLSYISDAEERLDADMKQYMRDNNVYYFDYPLKFDEYFLAKNINILSQLRPNTIVRFQYNSEQLALYVKQLTIKYDNTPLPQYDITLTDDVEIVLNPVGQVSDDVSKLRMLIGQGGVGSGNATFDSNAPFVRKDIDDTTNNIIRILNGLQLGENFSTGLLGEGGIIRVDDDGKTYIEADKLYVRMKFYADTIEVRRFLHSGGNNIKSPAGINCTRVEYIDSNGNITSDPTEAVKYRCYFKATDNDKKITNDFVVGDLAFCGETNVDNGSLSQHRYWRAVVGRNAEGVTNENNEMWIDLSATDCETGSGIPIAQDDIIQLGNKTDTTRQGAIIEYVSGEDSPSYMIYQGINSYSLNGRNKLALGYNSSTGRAYLNVYGDFFFGNNAQTEGQYTGSYIKYDSSTGDLDIKGTINATSTIGGDSIEAYIKAHQDKGWTQSEIESMIVDQTSQEFSDINTAIETLQNQADGAIETWFYNGAPTLSNVPASSWNTPELKEQHLGDLYYDNQSGYAYRFIKTGNTYSWNQLSDSAVIKALANAQTAQDTADGKRRVFVRQPLDTEEYDEGDFWVNATYPATGTKTYENDILRAVTHKAKNVSFNINHWTKASKYTDDTALTTFINGAYETYKQQVQTQIDGKAETWYQTTDPSTSWTDASEHIGDIWHNSSNSTINGVEAGQDAIWNGTSWEVSAVPAAVFDKIDGKADIFVSKPTTYNINDMWIIEEGLAAADMPTGCKHKDIVISSAKRTNSYHAADWSKKDRYTDDTKFDNYINQILNGTGATGDSATVANAIRVIHGALNEATVVDGGLVLTSLINLRSSNATWAGISGQYQANETGTGYKGHGIAAWYGGAMVDHEVSTSASNYAKSLFRFDGSGYLAGGNITWNAQGAVTIKNITTLSDSQNSNLLNELATFNSAFSFATSGQGSTTALSITPNVPFTSLSVLVDNTAKTVITQDANGAAKRIPYYSGATTTTTITNLEALYEDNSLSKKRFGLYIHGTTYGNTAEDLISGERGVMSFGDGGPQIVMGSAGQHIALLATDHDYAGGGASLHLVSDQERVVFTTQEITAKTRLSIGVNKPNTSYPLYVNGNAFVSRLYLASNVYLEYDSTNLGVHLVGAGLYSDSYISALGQSSGSGGGSGGGSSTLAGLTDVSINNATSGQVLAWNGSKWINTTFSGGGADMSAINAALSNYLPLSGGTMTGSIIFGATSKGISAKDGGGRTYIALRDNGSNLWIGAGASQSVHHTGATVISAGWGTYQTTANTTIKIAVPKMSGSTETSTNYDVLHVGNTTSLLIGLLGNGTSDFTDGTEIFSSYAADTGFATENYTDKIYKRSALKMWNYIKGKIGTDTTLTVAKANQLATARTLWGQSFNGTANVSGNMTGVGSISATGDITVTKSNAKISVSGTNGEVGLNSDNNRGVWDYTGSKWLIATNGTNSWLNFGNVGIGTTSPTTKLDVDGAVKATNFSADGSGVAPFYSSTTTLCTNVNADLLDGWHKDNILPLGYIYSSTASLSSYWCKVWSLDMSALQNSDRDATFLVQHGNRGQRGIIHVNVRQTSTAGGGSYTFPSSSNYVSLVSGNIPLDKVRLYQNTSTGICELWLNGNARYGGYSVTMLKKSQLNTKELTSLGTMYSTTFTSAQTLPSGSSVSYTTMSASEQVVGAITANDNITVNKQNGKVSVVGNNGEIGLNSATNRGVWDYTSGAWLIGTNGTNTFLSRGNVGIGTTSPSYKLHVSGSIYATEDVTALSDIRHKNVVSEVNAMVEDISKLPVFYFKWKNCRGDDNLHIGTSAQAVQKLFPELVLGGEELSVNYGVLGTTLGILNSRKLINHEERIKFLEDYNKLLIEDNKALKERIKALEDAA